ncbi:MAG: response regulator, partial [Saprospiraceae bacterium]|nr:response regulator [Saprospiraceae bacterium]
LQVTATIHSFIPPLAPATVNDQLLTVQSAQRPLPLALLIEDNRDVVRYLSYCLEADYRIEVASNGLEGIEKALKIVPDIIVSDVMMPGKDGFEVCKILKSDERSSHIPIILLTAKADIGSKLKGLERGADAYLPKPFYKEELLIRLRKLLELRQSLRQYYLSLATGTEGSNPLPKTSAPERKEDAFV